MDRLKRLQRLLRLRERAERQARLQLALAVREDLERRQALDEAHSQVEEARGIWNGELREGLGAGRLSLLRAYLDQRLRGRVQREGLVREWQPRLAARRSELGVASRYRQALEQWRDRLLARERLESERGERRVLDEIGLRESLRRQDPEHGEE